MKSKTLQQIKNKLRNILKDKEIFDIILFGSVIKGKAIPEDIDIALITNKSIPKIEGFHASIIKPEEFFKENLSLANTLLREGYSIKHGKFLAELWNFKNKILFVYELSSLSASKKVQIVNILRGKNKHEGMVSSYKGEWLANQVFTIPIEAGHIFEKFFLNFSIKFKKFYILIH